MASGNQAEAQSFLQTHFLLCDPQAVSALMGTTLTSLHYLPYIFMVLFPQLNRLGESGVKDHMYQGNLSLSARDSFSHLHSSHTSLRLVLCWPGHCWCHEACRLPMLPSTFLHAPRQHLQSCGGAGIFHLAFLSQAPPTGQQLQQQPGEPCDLRASCP